MNATWKAIAGVLVIFVLGWLAGAISTGVLIRHGALRLAKGGPRAVTAVLERRLTHNLSLTVEQQDKVHEIFVQNMTGRVDLQRHIQPEIQTLNLETMDELTAALKPDQLDKLRANLAMLRENTGRNIFALPTNEAVGTNAAGAAPPGH